eukprot:jgi/Mesen1/1525/ME001323S00375
MAPMGESNRFGGGLFDSSHLESGRIGNGAALADVRQSGRIDLDFSSRHAAEKVGGESGASLKVDRGAQAFGRKTTTNKDVRAHVKAVMEQNENLSRPTVVRNLTISYVFCVAVVVVLAFVGVIVVQVAIDNSYKDAGIVNVAGRQRMLSQMIAKDALSIIYNLERGKNATYFIQELAPKLQLWHDAHYGLWHGNKTLKLSKTKKRKIVVNFEAIDPNFKAIYAAGTSILALIGGSAVLTPAAFRELQVQVDVILANEGFFWKTMNTITNQYQQASHDHLQFVLLVTWILHGLLVLTLALEGIFLIRPVLRNMQMLINERFSLLRRSLETEAENRGVSLLMIGYMSHELQQCLHTVRSHLQLAHERLQPAWDAATEGNVEDLRLGCRDGLDAVEQSQISCGLMGTIIGDVANVRNLELGRMTLAVNFINISQVIREVVTSMLPRAAPGVELAAEFQTGLDQEQYQLDRHRLQQVLMNLVSNALRATYAGRVTVRVLRMEAEQRLRFEVLDNGPGLSAEQIKQAFEPFLEAEGDAIQEGFQMGLYIARMLVELQGGTLGVTGEPGEGSTFWFELPAVSSGHGSGVLKPTGRKHTFSGTLSESSPSSRSQLTMPGLNSDGDFQVSDSFKLGGQPQWSPPHEPRFP